MLNLNLIFDKFPQLETNRFILREVNEQDYNEIYNIYSEEEVVRYQQVEPMDKIELAQKSVIAFLKAFKNRKSIRWCITDREHNKVIGLVALHDFDSWNSKAEIGYILNKNYWRQNIMSEATQKVIHYAFEVIGLNRIEALVHPENTASVKLCLKLGFKLEGLKKQAVYNRWTGKYEDRQIYGLLKNYNHTCHGDRPSDM